MKQSKIEKKSFDMWEENGYDETRVKFKKNHIYSTWDIFCEFFFDLIFNRFFGTNTGLLTIKITLPDTLFYVYIFINGSLLYYTIPYYFILIVNQNL